MSAELFAPEPQSHSAVSLEVPRGDFLGGKEIPQPLSGSATAGYRTGKYTQPEWFSNYHSILEQSGGDCLGAQSIQRVSKTKYQDAEASVLQTQSHGTRLLGERIQDIHYWRSELQRHIEQLQVDITSLLGLKTRLEKALDATETPYAIALDNLNCRTRRPGPDLVKDNVEEELSKEVELIRNVQALLKQTTAQLVAQIKRNKKAKQMLEMDWSDKYQAYNLDDQCGRYSNMSPDTQHHPGTATMDCGLWTKFTQDNISNAFQEEQSTNDLRMLVERVLLDTTDDLRVQCSHVEQAFSQRCMELTGARSQLEMKLATVLEQIGAQERNIVALQQAIHNKEGPLRIAESRLYVRSHRPNMELCMDDPQISLEGEVRQINATVESLQHQLSEARRSLSLLEESRMTLEKDLNCKTHSLFIDREKCMIQRKQYPTVSTLSGY
uniref:Tektin n=1 Tax=Cynoglossus semilaevis TaxID=244447 RepID=A0A3P8VS98_CYNSE